MSNQMQSPPPRSANADEINRLHAEAEKLRAESRDTLHVALVAAWKAGQLLVAEKSSVRRTMGPGAWILWLERHFTGTPRTAQHYMRLASTVADVSFLKGMSLRQVYFSLGIATEPKSPARSVVLRPVPQHATLAVRLLALLPVRSNSISPEMQRAYRQDFRPLYERLRLLFE
jgi:hypothetical protein